MKVSLLVLVGFVSVCVSLPHEFPPHLLRASLRVSPYAECKISSVQSYPAGAHHHWVWHDNHVATQETLTKLVDDYLAHDIKVGAVDVDSTWSTGFNNFKFEKSKYPDPQGMVNNFHSKNVRIILWATSMIDTDSDNYGYARNHSYCVRNAMKQPMKPIHWWHGDGCLLDYTNSEAVEWWHSQLDYVLDLGIDGWKCDGTDPYIMELVLPHGNDGKVLSYRKYADLYYSDFLDYSRRKLGADRLIV